MSRAGSDTRKTEKANKNARNVRTGNKADGQGHGDGWRVPFQRNSSHEEQLQ